MPKDNSTTSVVQTTGILNANVASYLDALEISEVLVGTATGTLASSVYSSTISLPYKKRKYSTPPKILAFRSIITNNFGYVSTQSDLLPDMQLDYNEFLTIFGGGFVVTKFAKAEAFTDHVTISAYSTSSYTESYLVYVLKDKANAGIQ